MATGIYKATKTRSNRPGWSVTFRHPRRSDARGKNGLKVRRGLNTANDVEADRLVAQLNELLSDQSWWSLDRRIDAERRFDSIVVSAFFDGIEVGKLEPRELRETVIPLPTRNEGYSRVMLVGVTGAGKTTLLRHLIGSDHRRDRFPSTSTAKTTTADIEIVTAEGPFRAAITFMTEHEVRCAVDECLEEACVAAVRNSQSSDTEIAEALLEHREQRFRLSYILGTWKRDQPGNDATDEYTLDSEYELSEPDALVADELVATVEHVANIERLREYIARIWEIARGESLKTSEVRGNYQDLDNANQRQEWLEDFADSLYEKDDFAQLSLDIVDAIADRFDLVEAGSFARDGSGWPTIWSCEEKVRESFLKQVRWFSSNHDQQFGRLLTPLVDGIRVCGSFQPDAIELRDKCQRLVLLDGEGLGHSAKEAFSVSTKVTAKFSEVDMILLVDTAQSPMQAAPLELLRSVGSSGHGHKLAVAFTHFDQVKGDNLRNPDQKRSHVRASIGNALSGLRDSLGAPVSEILERQLRRNDFYLAYLDKSTERIPRGFKRDLGELLELMQESSKYLDASEAAPTYNLGRLELPLRDATDSFKTPWWGRLGLVNHDGIRKEHWGRIKALCRRIANRWDNCEYSGLRPAADLIRQLQISISFWLDNPDGWTRRPDNEEEGQVVINNIRQKVYDRIHTLANRRLIVDHSIDWRTAFGFSGRGSSFERARQMAQIYDEAAPSVTSVMDRPTQEFLEEVIQIVKEAVQEAGGSVEGTPVRQSANEF